jgi:hypothetical protein
VVCDPTCHLKCSKRREFDVSIIGRSFGKLSGTGNEVLEAWVAHVDSGCELAVVKAPPGSGKTWHLLEVARHALTRRLRVAIATQTNSQADDVCRRLADSNQPCVRFAAKGYGEQNLGKSVAWQTEASCLPNAPCIVVATTAKWGLINLSGPFDLCLVEEAWQMAWSDFMLLGQVAARFILIGDPGQIPPVVPIDSSRWETAPLPPHLPAPELLRETKASDLTDLSLPRTHRLPFDTTTLIRPFYDITFDSVAGPGDRRFVARGRGGTLIDGVIDHLATGSVVGLTLPTPAGGPPLELDEEVAQSAVDVVTRMLEREVEVYVDGKLERLQPKDIGLSATHHVVNAQLELRLPRKLREALLYVETPERWQGLQRKVMVVVHPLSGVTEPTDFDLETGRLCVMASRHQVGLVVVGRDHILGTLDDHLPVAQQALGRPDVAGRGQKQHLGFWKTLIDTDRIVG